MICIKRNGKYRAIQFTGDNREKICDALHIKLEYCQRWVNSDTKEMYLLVDAPGCHLGKMNVNEWLIMGIGASNGSYAVLTPDTFESQFEELRD
jgi:hypothetical protein